MKAKTENNPNRFTGEAAQRTLDEVRNRYGLHRPTPQAHSGVKASSSAPKEPAKQQPRPAVRPGPPMPKTALAPVERTKLDRLADEVKSRPLELAAARHPSCPASGFPSDNHTFHYLIRIAECALTLHCEVNADDDAAARHQVKQIPNLMAWRQISSEELAEITGKRDGSIKVR